MHKHDYYMVQFSWGTYWECECGHRPTKAEWTAWNDQRPEAD